jgi:predicted acyltransferase
MRYLSIDFYRGLTIAFMLIVNDPGSWSHVFAPLLHAEWHGCTPTDLVFPSFLFIIGTSMWFSFEKYDRKLNKPLLLKIAKRTGLLVLIGLLLAWFPFYDKHISQLRIPGVMVRLGLCYGLAALLALSLSGRGLAIAVSGILLGYWGLMYWGGMAGFDPYSLEANVVRRVDLFLLGPEHLWAGKGIPFDPEGLLSTLPAAANVLFGWWAGQIMQQYQLQKMRVVYQLLLVGNALALAGVVWNWGFPMNKMLWTSSFVLYTSGLSMIFLSFAVWVIDVRGWERGTAFFLVLGANPLFAFVAESVLAKLLLKIKWSIEGGGHISAWKWIYTHIFVPIEPYKMGSLLFALAFTFTIWLLCYVLYRNKIFIKL